MMKKPKISIIIPSYNMVDFIEETIQSILSQSYSNIECIVMDGGSNDGTVDILRRYEGKIRWISEKDKGQSDAINKGLKLAGGDIIAELDADDAYEKGSFQKVAKFFEENPETKWAYGKCRVIDRNKREINKPETWSKNYLLKRYSYNKLLVVNFIPQPAVFWRRELIDDIGLFDVDEHLVMDYDYWLRCGAKYKPGYINDYLASWRVHSHSKSSVNFSREHREALNVARKYTDSITLITLHYLIYFGLIGIHSILNFASRFRGWIRLAPFETK